MGAAIIKAALRKEAIKLKLLLWLPFIGAAAVCYEVYLTYKGMSAMHGPTLIWADLIYKRSVHFDRLSLLLPVSGAWIAALQFVPECTGKRLRLLFHLPVPQRVSLHFIALTGCVCVLLLIAACALGMFAVARKMGYPPELYTPMLKTLIPWGLSALCAYFASAAAIAEPSVPRKLALALMGLGYAYMLSASTGLDSMQGSLPAYILLCLPWPLALDASAMRLKEGRA